MDPVFLILVLVLLTIGLVMLWSASFPQSEYDSNYTTSTRYLQKQALCAVLGLGCMAAFSRIPAFQGIGQGAGGIDVAAGAATGKDHVHKTSSCNLASSRCREMPRITPISPRFTASAVPP